MGVDNLRRIVDDITSLPIKVLTTHAHWDHIGSHSNFDSIAIHELEKQWLESEFPLPLQAVKQNLTWKPCNFPANFRLEDYTVFKGKVSETFHDGSLFDLGNRKLQVIHTPGHSPGHCCFYEAERGYLYSGDLVYCGCLDAFYPTTNPEHFRDSIHKIKQLSVKRILPGHHCLDVPVDIISRIDRAFEQLERTQNLKHGCGTFDYGDFQIHI